MEEELKQKIADSTARICKAYKTLETLLSSIRPASEELGQFLQYLNSSLQYASVHFQAAAIDLSVCKRRHDPARLLSDIESRFKAQEQGFFTLYPNAAFKAQLTACFVSARPDFEVLESCLTAIG